MDGYISFYSSVEVNELELSQIATDFLQQAGIVRQSGNLGFTGAQLSPLDGLKYNITTGGTFYIANDSYAANGTNPRFWLGWMNGATETLTFGANSSGSTRIDLICIKVDTTVTDGDPDNGGVVSLVVVAGTPGAGVPATPADHIALYTVTIANGETEITDAEVTDVRTEAYLKIQSSLTLSGNEVTPTNKIFDQAFDGWIPAGETWTYDTADSPIFTFKVSGDKTGKYKKGQRIRMSQSTGGTKYFIIHGVSYSAPDTTITIYGGDDYTLNNQTISSPHYSREYAPVGFPLERDKWGAESTKGFSNLGGAPTQNVYYNLGTWTIVVPIGEWIFVYECSIAGSRASGDITMQSTIATVNNGSTGEILGQSAQGAPFTRFQCAFSQERTLQVAAKTTYYHNVRTLATSLTDIDISANAPRLSRMKYYSAYL